MFQISSKFDRNSSKLVEISVADDKQRSLSVWSSGEKTLRRPNKRHVNADNIITAEFLRGHKFEQKYFKINRKISAANVWTSKPEKNIKIGSKRTKPGKFFVPKLLHLINNRKQCMARTTAISVNPSDSWSTVRLAIISRRWKANRKMRT